MSMSKFIVAIAALVGFTSVQADTYVDGYYRKNGTYVQPHYRSSPNSTINDNYSTAPNVNPYTGERGTRSPSYSTPSYSTPPNNYSKPSSNYNNSNDSLF